MPQPGARERKLSLAIRAPDRTVGAPMTKRLLLSFLGIAVLLSTGCLFNRKEKKPKETTAIATEVEKEFHQRWIAKRVSELNARGVAGADAVQQAESEFAQKFAFARDRRAKR